MASERYVAFASIATNLVAADTNGRDEIFVRVIDQDGDGSLDERDNCFAVANPGQANADADSQSNACDADDDGMPDTFETNNGFNPLIAADAGQDADADGFSNLEEFQTNTDPHNPNSDRAVNAALIAIIQSSVLLDD